MKLTPQILKASDEAREIIGGTLPELNQLLQMLKEKKVEIPVHLIDHCASAIDELLVLFTKNNFHKEHLEIAHSRILAFSEKLKEISQKRDMAKYIELQVDLAEIAKDLNQVLKELPRKKFLGIF